MKLSSLDKSTSRYRGWISRLLVALGALTGSVSAMAAAGGPSGTLEYGPLAGPGAASPTSIPTMGGIGLVLLSVFLLLVFWRMHRSGAIQGGRFMMLALATGVLASGVGGVKLVSDSVAQNEPTAVFKDMVSESGGVLSLSDSEGGYACVRNDTEIPLKILSMESLYGQGVTVEDGPVCVPILNGGTPGYSGCEVNGVLQPDEVCGITLLSYVPNT